MRCRGRDSPLETIVTNLVLLLVVVVSGIVSRSLPLPIPRPLVQIASGAVIGLRAHMQVPLDPDVFFLLFVPPLLFLDGWRIPTEELLKDRATIVQMALGLVVATVFGVGFFITWLIPTLPLAAALALAAVLSPTDPISVSTIATRIHIPRRMMHILEGESLLNDATGLICMRFAIAYLVSGTFSALDTGLTFLWVAGGGLAVGVGVTWVTARGKDWLSRRIGEESGSQIVISLLIPFLAYEAALALDASGIFAAVAAGVTLSAVDASGNALGSTRMRRNSVWDAVQFVANGIVFVLLGEQLPRILEGANATVRVTGHTNPWWLLAYVLVIYAAMLIVRMIWVWVSLGLRRFRAVADGGGHWPSGRLVAATSVAGVRGAITLAGVLTLPVVLADSTAFPGRDLAIFIAMGVIIVSLIAATIGLPLLLGSEVMGPEPSDEADKDRARSAAAEAAIAEIDRIRGVHGADDAEAALYAAAAALVAGPYHLRIETRAKPSDGVMEADRSTRIERELQLAALRSERSAIFRMMRKREIGSESARALIRERDLLEAHLEAQGRSAD